MKNNYLVQAWLVLVLACGFGAGLACVETNLKGRISQNKINKTYDQIPLLVPGAAKSTTLEFTTDDEKIAYKAIDADGKHIGWVFKTVGQGFADRIELLIGVDAEAKKITGLYVLDQKETPALGDNITKTAFRGQFAGMDASKNVKVSKTQADKENNVIRAVTGATVSSQSVADIVNKALKEFQARKDELKEKEQK